ncbi:MAG: hypothetical protein RLZZ188_1162 [Verrucomicrobiota bacterium]|jgi:glycosyltransferase involved in cell wall biosynthesis
MNAPDESRRARIRVFLTTYRRHTLLPRAISSLLAQTMTDWVCEVHNDDPADGFPGEYLAQLADSRFVHIRHERNLGGVATFNLLFRATPEPFYSLLEDDNWWEPGFLAEMLDVATQYPDAEIFWANMRIWQEKADGSFADTGQTVSPCSPGEPPREVHWGHSRQIFGALHSNGAMLVRSRNGATYSTPDVPFAVVEPFRERSWRYPIVFNPAPLANYSLTRQSHRTKDASEWATVQVMLAATFLRYARYDNDRPRLAQLWADARHAKPPHTNTLLLASFVDPACSFLREGASVADWARLLRSSLRRPHVLKDVYFARRVHADWWEWLDLHTARRFAEAPPARPQQ